MKVSVLMAVLNFTPSLNEALAGVAAQLDQDIELIVGEPQPGIATDGMLQPLAGSRTVVRRARINDPSSSAAVRNQLLELATGDLIAFIEPQDVWLPRHLAVATQHIGGGADIAVSNARVHDAKSDRAPAEISIPAALATAAVRTLFSRDAIPSASCVVMRRATALAAGAFDEQLGTADTRDFWLRCAVAGARFAVTQRPTCRCERTRGTPNERALLTAEHAVLFYEKHRDLSAVPAALRRRMLAGALVSHGRLLRPVDAARATRCFMRAWSLQPVHVQTLGQFALTEWRQTGPTTERTDDRP